MYQHYYQQKNKWPTLFSKMLCSKSEHTCKNYGLICWMTKFWILQIIGSTYLDAISPQSFWIFESFISIFIWFSCDFTETKNCNNKIWWIVNTKYWDVLTRGTSKKCLQLVCQQCFIHQKRNYLHDQHHSMLRHGRLYREVYG